MESRTPGGQIAVILDMDGLMLDTERPYVIACKRAAEDLGYGMTDEILLSTIGRTAGDTEEIFCRCLGESFSHLALSERTRFHLDRHYESVGLQIKPGLLQLLDFLEARSIPKAVATSTARARAEWKLELAGIRQRFQAMVTGDEIVNGKPAPDIFLKAAERLGVLAKNCIVLEDSEPGIRAAHAAGMTAIMVPDLKQPSDEVLLLAHRVFPSLIEALEHLDACLPAASR